MKNLFLKAILVVGLATTIVACSKDEETTPTATIVGTWEATSQSSKITLNGTVLQDSTETYAAGELSVEFKQSIIAVTHDNEFSAKSDRTIVMSDGKILI